MLGAIGSRVKYPGNHRGIIIFQESLLQNINERLRVHAKLVAFVIFFLHEIGNNGFRIFSFAGKKFGRLVDLVSYQQTG
jgi:hypothetical protein